MSEIESALKDLESATAALTENPLDDGRASAALNRRSRAIARLAKLTSAPLLPAARQETLHRLRLICGAGEQAQQRLMNAKREAMAEWNQWSQIYRALGASGHQDPKKIDCRG